MKIQVKNLNTFKATFKQNGPTPNKTMQSNQSIKITVKGFNILKILNERHSERLYYRGKKSFLKK